MGEDRPLCAGCNAKLAMIGWLFCRDCSDEESREITLFRQETHRLLEGWPDDRCAECGEDIGDLPIGEVICRKCASE